MQQILDTQQDLNNHTHLWTPSGDTKMELRHPFLTTPTLIFFDQILISMNMYQHAKNQALSLFRDIAYLIILQSDWPITFWSISQEPDFSQVWNLCKNTTNNIHFIVLYVWEIVVRKNLTNFEGCHFAQFYILIWWSFPKIEPKSFNSGPCFFKLVKLGTISLACCTFS